MTSLGFGVASIFYSDSIIIFHQCMGKEERFHLDILGRILPRGILIRLEFFNPFRLCFNTAGVLFIFVVPILYFHIFKFRKRQDNSIQGISVKVNINSKMIFQGISKVDRNKRKQKNIVSTHLNFTAWFLQVTKVQLIPIYHLILFAKFTL